MPTRRRLDLQAKPWRRRAGLVRLVSNVPNNRTCAELFAGVGGLSLGFEWAGMRPIWHAEIEPFPRAVLRERFPEAQLFGDVRTLDPDELERPWCLAGGFPCQPHSLAGLQRGEHDERNLWPEFRRLVRHLRPAWVVAENVLGIRSTIGDRVQCDLEAEGYAVRAVVVGACEVGAPHRRRRVFFIGRLADADGEDLRFADWRAVGTRRQGAALARAQRRADLADSDLGRSQGEWLEEHGVELRKVRRELDRRDPTRRRGWPTGPGQPQADWEPRRAETLAELGRGSARFSRRVVSRLRRERLKALGNAVVPQVSAAIGRAILETEARLGGGHG